MPNKFYQLHNFFYKNILFYWYSTNIIIKIKNCAYIFIYMYDNFTSVDENAITVDSIG